MKTPMTGTLMAFPASSLTSRSAKPAKFRSSAGKPCKAIFSKPISQRQRLKTHILQAGVTQGVLPQVVLQKSTPREISLTCRVSSGLVFAARETRRPLSSSTSRQRTLRCEVQPRPSLVRGFSLAPIPRPCLSCAWRRTQLKPKMRPRGAPTLAAADLAAADLAAHFLFAEAPRPPFSSSTWARSSSRSASRRTSGWSSLSMKSCTPRPELL
mmetsp:Transcript_46384/g.100878  ORF Transcript_46384/g.100878 Transcript_46384/m.100878 type:complete len:212 (-) Transcript_46384:2474-3109(-)